MKYTLLLLSISITFSAIAGPPVSPSQSAGIEGYVKIPAGTTADGKEMKAFSMSPTEVTNGEYKEFIQALLAANDTAKLRIAMVDTARWTMLPGGQVFTAFYYQHPAYASYPVVNVSRRAALLYCEWLTERFRAAGKQMHVALPTEAQWTYAAQGGDKAAIYPCEGNTLLYEKKGRYYQTNMANYKVGKAISTPTDNKSADITAPSESYMPNHYKLYNMSGNVAEMLSDQSYTKGGSWNSPADKLKIDAREDYDPTAGSPMVGFRPVIW